MHASVLLERKERMSIEAVMMILNLCERYSFERYHVYDCISMRPALSPLSFSLTLRISLGHDRGPLYKGQVLSFLRSVNLTVRYVS